MRLAGSCRLKCDDGLFGLKWLRNCVGSFLAASVAQLDRASDFGSEGYRFKSCRTRHFSKEIQGFRCLLNLQKGTSSIKSSNTLHLVSPSFAPVAEEASDTKVTASQGL